MAPMALKTTALVLTFNLLFVTLFNPMSAQTTPMPFCRRDSLAIGACANVLNTASVVVGAPPTPPCCSLIQGLVDLEAAVCLCTAVRASALGTSINVNLAVVVLLNACGMTCPSNFQCPP